MSGPGPTGATRPIVYIASPYTRGDQSINTRFQCETFDKLMNDGKVWPFAPLWNHFQHTLFPRQAQDWVRWDNAVLVRCDALVRVDAEYNGGGLRYFEWESEGSDAEVALATANGIPVFYSIEDLYKWVATFTGAAL